MSDDVRPDVVQTIVAASLSPTAETLERLAALGSVTPAEKAAADSLLLSILPMQGDQADRTMEALEILIGGRPEAAKAPWSQLFDALTEENIDRLRELYDAMPDGARAEFDGRYGRPQL